jgi:stress-induced morphogen
VAKSKIPFMFIKQINKQRPRQQNTCDSLGSISAVVTNNEDRNTHAEDVLVASTEENSSESEPDDDEGYECVVCRLEFSGESKLEQHRRIVQHWGSEIGRIQN